MVSFGLVPNQNKCHFVNERPGQNKLSHLVPNQTKSHLVIDWPGQTKAGHIKCWQ